MKTRYDYIKPEVEIVNVEVESEIMASSPLDVDMGGLNEYKGGTAGSKKRSLWEED